MNREEAFRQVTEYWALVKKGEKQPALSGDRRAVMRIVNQRLPVINKIMHDLAPDMRLIHASRVSEHLTSWPRVERALVILRSWEAMNALQQKAAEPVLPMSSLDPVVSEAALPLWLAGKYRQAVNEAAIGLNIYIQNQIGRHDISDKDLVAQAFSEKAPEKGKSRLRCPGNPQSETVRSQLEGARAFSIGTFQAIRNPAHHLPGDWNPALAFHHLAALSQVAYWFRNWDIVRYSPPPSDYSAANAVLAQYLQPQANTARSATPPTE